MAMFDQRGDFELADVTRLRDHDLAISILPEKVGAGQLAVSMKDLAFLYEAILERNANVGVIYEGYVNDKIVAPWSITGGNDLEYGLGGCGLCIRQLLERAADAYRNKLLYYGGMAVDDVDGKVVDQLANPTSDADIRALMTGGDDRTAFTHIPRLPLEYDAVDDAPFKFPADAVRDLYWCLRRMDCVAYYSPSSVDTSGVTYTETWTSTTRRYTASTGEWSENTYTATYMGTGLYGESKSESWNKYQSGNIDNDSYDSSVVHAGTVVLTYNVGANGDRVDGAYLVIEGRSDGSRNGGSGSDFVYLYSRYVVLELGTPDEVSQDKTQVKWRIPVSDIIAATDGLRFDLPPVDKTVDSSSTQAGRTWFSSPLFAAIHFDYRTSLADLQWQYEPDWDETLP